MSPVLQPDIDDFLADAERRRSARPNTLRAYRTDLAALARTVATPLAQLTHADLDPILHDTQYTPATLRRRASVLATFFRWAVREQRIATDPMTFYQSPRTDRALPRPVRNRDDRKAIDKLINAAPYPYRAIFTILRETGMRANEVLGLAVGDVVLDAGNEGLLIRSAKNRTERVQVLGPNATPNTLRRLRKHLRDLKKVADHTPLFFSNRGTRLSYDALNYQWWKLCQQHGLVNDQGQPRYTLHQLRHTRGTEMIEQRYPLHVVQKTLGHLDPRSTQVYVELAEDQLRHELESHCR